MLVSVTLSSSLLEQSLSTYVTQFSQKIEALIVRGGTLLRAVPLLSLYYSPLALLSTSSSTATSLGKVSRLSSTSQASSYKFCIGASPCKLVLVVEFNTRDIGGRDSCSVFRYIFILDLLFLHLIACVSTIVALIRVIYISSIFFKKKQYNLFSYTKNSSLLVSENIIRGF